MQTLAIKGGKKKVIAKRPSLMINAISNWIVLIINAVLALIIARYIIFKLGKSGFGVWALVSGLVSYYGILRMGVGSAILRYISLNDGRGDQKAVSGTFSTAMVIYLAVGLLISLIAIFFSNTLASFFGQGREFSSLIILTGVSAGLVCPCAVLEASLRAREKFALANITILSMTLVRNIGIAVVLYLGYGLLGMGTISLLVSVVDWIVMTAVFRRACPDIKFKLSSINLAHFRYLLSFGAMATLVSVGMSLRYDSDRIVVGKMMQMEVLGIYAVVAAIIANYRNMIRAITRILNPRFSFLDGTGDSSQSVSLFLRSAKMANVLCSGFGFLIILLGPEFIRLWFGHGFEQSYPALFMLMAANTIGQAQCVSAAYLNGIGKQAIMAVITISEGIISILASLYIGRKFGLTGIAAGIAISIVLIQGIAFPVYICRFLKLSLLKFYTGCMLVPWLLSAAMIFLIELLVRNHGLLATWPRFMFFAIVFVGIYSFAAYNLILNHNERTSILNGLTSMVPGFKISARRM